MLSVFATAEDVGAEKPVILHAVLPKKLEGFLAARAAREARWLNATGFAAKEGELQLVPDERGGLQAAVLGLGAGRDPHALALFFRTLAAGVLRLGQCRCCVRWGARGLC